MIECIHVFTNWLFFLPEVKILSTMLRWLEGKEEKCPSLKSEQVQQLLKNREYSDCPICHSCILYNATHENHENNGI